MGKIMLKGSTQIVSRLIPMDYSELELSDGLFEKLRHFVVREIFRIKKGGTVYALKTGKVVGEGDKPIEGATVVGTLFATTTDKNGNYSLYCPPGDEKIKVYTLKHKTTHSNAGSQVVLKKRESKLLLSFESKKDEFEAEYESDSDDDDEEEEEEE